MAAVSGIELLLAEERNPLATSTYGTGLLLKATIDAAFTEIITGIGGSATNDGDAGIAQDLEFKLMNKIENQIGPGGESLQNLHRIDCDEVHRLIKEVKITVACDVQNPLVGPTRATSVCDPQKGATPEMIEFLEQGMLNYANILKQEFGANYSNIPVSRAACGLGASLMAFCDAQIRSGFELIAELTSLEEQISKVSLVITGEGNTDSQTAYEKTISGIAGLCKKHNVPLVALVGMVSGNLSQLYQQGLTSAFAIANQPMIWMILKITQPHSFGQLQNKFYV